MYDHNMSKDKEIHTQDRPALEYEAIRYRLPLFRR